MTLLSKEILFKDKNQLPEKIVRGLGGGILSILATNCVHIIILRTQILLYFTKQLRDFSFFLSSTFVYEPIWIKNSMNTNNIKKFFFIKGHKKVILIFLIMFNLYAKIILAHSFMDRF